MIFPHPTDKRVELKGLAPRRRRRDDAAAPVNAVDLAVKRSELVALLGPAGSGKTTLLRLVAGLDAPGAGTVLFNGLDVTLLRPRSRDVAFVFREPALYPGLSVERNVAAPLRAAGAPRHAVQRRVDELIERLGLVPLRRRMPRRLSPAEAQRVALARALVRDASVFLMDQPLDVFPPDERIALRVQLRALHRDLGATTLLATDDPLDAIALADRVVVLGGRGRVKRVATAEEIWRDPVVRRIAEAARAAPPAATAS